MANTTRTRLEALKDTLYGEVGRRLVHASGSALPALYLLGLATWPQVQVLFVLAAVTTVVLEFLRLTVGLDWFIYEHLTREYEQDSIAGYMMYMVSSTAVVLVAPSPDIAIPAVLMLMLADPLSGTLSSNELRLVKRPRVLAAMFVICSLITLPFVYHAPLAVVLGALGGTVADGVKPTIGEFVLDDNLTIAPVAAFGIWLGLQLNGFVL